MTTSTAADTRPARTWLTLLPFLAAVAAASVVGGLSASAVPQEYRSLEQPAFAPPSWLFGPVWTVLYVMIGVAGWLLWRERGRSALLTLWIVQLVLNTLWTPLFFGLGLRGLALIDIALLDVAVVVLIAMAWRVSRTAALLLVPYLAWVLFATSLNAAIWWLNQG